MTKYALGDFVKAEFTDDETGESEWMWVEVNYSDDEQRLVFGKLDSQPIINTDLKLGQELAVSVDKTRDHRRFP